MRGFRSACSPGKDVLRFRGRANSGCAKRWTSRNGFWIAIPRSHITPACRALILAKLATTCWRSHRLAEAEDYFQKAVQTQSALVAGFSDLPPHDQVLLQFLRLRFAQVDMEHNARGQDRSGLDVRQAVVGSNVSRVLRN